MCLGLFQLLEASEKQTTLLINGRKIIHSHFPIHQLSD